MEDIRDYMTKKYPTNKYIQCPVPERCWQDILEYAEYYHQSKLKLLGEHNVVGQSEQLVCDCGNPNLTWYGNDDDKTYFCFDCKKEITN